MAALASAGLLSYYGMITGTATVSQSVTLDGQTDNANILYAYSNFGGESDISAPHYMTNNAGTPAVIELQKEYKYNNVWYSPGNSEVDVYYEGIDTATQLQLTTGDEYKRNPSIVKDGTTWYLFYAQDNDTNQNGKTCNAVTPNCDKDEYEIFVIKSTDDGKTWGTAVKVSTQVTSFNQRDVSAVFDGTDLYAFVSSGSSVQDIYYYKSTDGGATWTAGSAVSIGVIKSGHFDAVYRNGYFWILYGTASNLKAFYSTDASTWTTVTVPMMDMIGSPVLKAMVDGSSLTVVWAKGTDGVYYTTSLTPATANSWSSPVKIADSDVFDYDPVLYKDLSDKYWLFWAPEVMSGSDAQWINYKTADSIDGLADATSISYKFTKADSSNVWWDYWPEVTEDANGKIVVFYTSESSGDSTTATGVNGNIWEANFGNVERTIPANTNLGLYIYNGFAIDIDPKTYYIRTKVFPVTQ